MKKSLLLIPLSLVSIVNCFAQHVTTYDHEDARQRGYYDRPYLRYEAEPDWCVTGNSTTEVSTAEFLTRSDDQRLLQSEASNQQALTLKSRGDYVEWTKDHNSADSNTKRDGLTIRYSVPDGKTGRVALYIDGKYKRDIELKSDHSWLYCSASNTGDNGGSPEKYSYNNSDEGPIVRMRFDETHVRIDEKIADNAKIRLVFTSEDGAAHVTIDFIELEPVPEPYQVTDTDKVWENYDLVNWDSEDKYANGQKSLGFTSVNAGDGNDLLNKINNNGGNTVIYIPEGDYYVPGRIVNGKEYVKIIGAGMWYVNIHFTNGSDGGAGFYSDYSKCLYKGFYMNSDVNFTRYPEGWSWYHSPGKGFQGCFGTFTEFHDIWVEHFECGIWFGKYDADAGWQANHLTIKNCRFRNNYADGINLCRGAHDCVVEHCSFRNNGDDDMACWSADGLKCFRNIYRYNTAEHNWRASSLGIFGGENNKAYNILITDGLEAGARIVSDFPGCSYTGNPSVTFHDISIYHCGCIEGAEGTSGDFWGHRQGALHIHGSKNYTVSNFNAYNFDIYNSRGHAVMVRREGQPIQGLRLTNFTVNGTGVNYGVNLNETTDKSGFNGIHVCGTTASNDPSDGANGSSDNALIGTFTTYNIYRTSTRSTESGVDGVPVHDPIKYLGSNYTLNDILTGVTIPIENKTAEISVEGDCITVKSDSEVSVFNISGQCVGTIKAENGYATISGLESGIYVVKPGTTDKGAKVIIR